MNYLFFLIPLVCIGQSYINAADVTCGRAVDGHIAKLVNLINTHACKADKQIVVVPEIHRHGYIEHGVHSNRFFVAQENKNEEIVGFKKLFLVDDQQELDNLLRNEIRCIDGKLLAQGMINLNDYTQEPLDSDAAQPMYESPTTYIYNGADFTQEAYRGQGINSQLTACALALITDDVIAHVKDNGSEYITMLFGLTDDNAGQTDNLLAGRSKGIVKLFDTLAQNVAQKTNSAKPTTMLASRSLAFKPSFDPKSQECVPLSDDQSIKGCGCVLACKLGSKESTC
jgi:hypothetical protein